MKRSISEAAVDPLAVRARDSGLRLLHFRVDVKARVAQLRDFAREQPPAVHRIAEDDRLIDFEFGEERVEAMNLLPLLDEGVELRDPLQREVVLRLISISFLRCAAPRVQSIIAASGEGARGGARAGVLFFEILHSHRECGREQANLSRSAWQWLREAGAGWNSGDSNTRPVRRRAGDLPRGEMGEPGDFAGVLRRTPQLALHTPRP